MHERKSKKDVQNIYQWRCRRVQHISDSFEKYGANNNETLRYIVYENYQMSWHALM